MPISGATAAGIRQQRVDEFQHFERLASANAKTGTTGLLKYLREENRYARAVLQSDAAWERIRTSVNQELHSIQLLDSGSGPLGELGRDGRYYFAQSPWVFSTDDLYGRENRRMLLDCGSLGFTSAVLSPDYSLLAFIQPSASDEAGTLRVKCLQSGQNLADSAVPDVVNFVWSADSRSLIYTRLNRQQLRPDKVMCHFVAGGCLDDQLIFHETDQRFFVDASQTKDKASCKRLTLFYLPSTFRP